MTRIAAITDQNATTELQTVFADVKRKIGMVPNLHRTFAQSPAALDGYLKFADAVSKSTLSAADQERIALGVAQANSCGYCLSAHTLIARGAGLSPDETLAARQGEGNALAVFARKVVEKRGAVSDADIAAARTAGFGDAHLVDVVAAVALNVLTNYLNNVAQTDIDFPVVAL
jgi:uncharacterized peroxidase-related enzyme